MKIRFMFISHIKMRNLTWNNKKVIKCQDFSMWIKRVIYMVNFSLKEPPMELVLCILWNSHLGFQIKIFLWSFILTRNNNVHALLGYYILLCTNNGCQNRNLNRYWGSFFRIQVEGRKSSNKGSKGLANRWQNHQHKWQE